MWCQVTVDKQTQKNLQRDQRKRKRIICTKIFIITVCYGKELETKDKVPVSLELDE